MQVLLLVPFLASLYFVWKGSVRSAFLNVYLPVLLLTPMSYTWRLPHLFPLNMVEMAILPMMAALPFYAKLWRPRRLDFWILGLMVSEAVAEGHNSVPASGLLVFVDLCFAMYFPYMCGRLLIEQWMQRSVVVKRIVMLIALAGVLGLSEFRLKDNLYRRVFSRVFPGSPVGWVTQFRYGFGRISGPYGHAILAGIVFGIALVFLFYILRTDRRWQKRPLLNIVPLKLRTLITLALVCASLCTISRGPWIGIVISMVIAVLGLRRRLDAKNVVFLLLLCAAGLGLRAYLENVANPASQSEIKQDDPNQTAQYRTQLWPVYMPIVEQGGWLGFGVSAYPKAGPFTSIDNEYLFILVTQGYTGLIFFSLILMDTLLTLYKALDRMKMYEDRFFTFTMGGIVIGLLFTMATVYLDEQPRPIFYLLLGWIQALRPANSPAPAVLRMAQPQFRFNRVWT